MPKKSFDCFSILSGVRNVTITSLTSALESTKKVELIKLSYFNFLYHSSLKIYRELYLDLTSRSLLRTSYLILLRIQEHPSSFLEGSPISQTESCFSEFKKNYCYFFTHLQHKFIGEMELYIITSRSHEYPPSFLGGHT